MRRRLLSTLLLLLLAVLTSSASAATTLVHLSQSSHGPAWAEWLNETAASFEKETGIKVEVRVAPGGANGMLEQYLVGVAGNVAPDVLDMSSVALPLMDDYFLDLRPRLEKDGILENIYPVLMRMATNTKGEVWGLPVAMQVIPTYYNMDILNAMGLPTPWDMGAGWNWDGVLDIARKATQDHNGDGTIDQYGTDRIYMRWYTQVAQAGGMHYDTWLFPTKAQFNTSPVMKAFEYIRTFYEMGYTYPHLAAGYQQQYFWFGKSALDFVDGPGMLGPNYLGGASFQFDMAPQPKGPANDATVVYPNSYFEIDRNTKNAAAAYEWVKYLITNQTVVTNMVKKTAFIPSTRRGAVTYGQVAGPSLPKHWQVFFEAASSPYAIPSYAHKSSEVTKIETQYLNEYWKGNSGLEGTVELLDAHLNAILAL